MKLLLTLFSILICVTAFAQKFEKISGLKEEVEIMIDPFGVPHIYAKNENDMFFAQGFQAASDRLFQFEMWRRQTRGLLSDMLGERELQKDIASRLFTYRGDPVAEFNHYHPNGYQIIHSFVNGVNAAIDNALLTPDSLPVEFRLLGIKPQYLKPEDIISRHQGLLGNLTDEWETALVVHQIGEDKTKEINW
ncbi:MAG: penicillin acylase family protein, partial [Bacteroidota bacterium]